MLRRLAPSEHPSVELARLRVLIHLLVKLLEPREMETCRLTSIESTPTHSLRTYADPPPRRGRAAASYLVSVPGSAKVRRAKSRLTPGQLGALLGGHALQAGHPYWPGIRKMLTISLVRGAQGTRTG
jgi:hypothetical protein